METIFIILKLGVRIPPSPPNKLGSMLTVNFGGPDSKWTCDKCGQTIRGTSIVHDCKPQRLKGSERKKLEADVEMRKLVHEFSEKIEHDPYQPGITHPIFPDDLQEIIEDLMFLRNFTEVTIKVTRPSNDQTILAEVTNRQG